MQPEQTTAGDGPDAEAVIRFLDADPDFLDRHRDVLSRLRIPHASGRAVSLIERQVSVLRDRCSSLEDHLRELIDVAQANERLQGRLHTLVQAVISADSLDAVVAATRTDLVENFGADTVHVLLVDVAAGDGYRSCAADDVRLAAFAGLLEEGGTRCGLPTGAELDALVEEHARADIGSAALIPLRHEGIVGVVMLTSRDESRFAVGKGVVFLDQLGGVLSRRVHAFGRSAGVAAGAPAAGDPAADTPELSAVAVVDAPEVDLAATCRLPA